MTEHHHRDDVEFIQWRSFVGPVKAYPLPNLGSLPINHAVQDNSQTHLLFLALGRDEPGHKGLKPRDIEYQPRNVFAVSK